MCWRDYNNAIPGSFKSLIVPAADVPQQLEIGILTSLRKAGASTFGEQCLWKLSAIHRRCRLFIKSQSYRVLSQRPHVYCVVQIHHVAANHTLLGGGRRSYHWDMCFKLFGTQFTRAAWGCITWPTIMAQCAQQCWLFVQAQGLQIWKKDLSIHTQKLSFHEPLGYVFIMMGFFLSIIGHFCPFFTLFAHGSRFTQMGSLFAQNSTFNPYFSFPSPRKEQSQGGRMGGR